MSYSVLLIIPVVVTAAVVVVALLVHGRIAGQVVRRARPADLPKILETSSAMLVASQRASRAQQPQPQPGLPGSGGADPALAGGGDTVSGGAAADGGTGQEEQR
ncbi:MULTISPECIES: hypothetical protein [Kitasatospora]|uniref:hypothetical protein n=1 Tax=Kitasatospora TaxID=2063 RepID=UPI0004C23A5E|nr:MULTISPECIES: hypothetical protein [Kitasatospora]